MTVEDQAYTGKALNPAVVVRYNRATLKKNRDYTVAFKNNTNVGTATATITGKGRYTGTKKVRFAINPMALKLDKLTAGKGQFTATWTVQAAQADGYQIACGLKKDPAAGRIVTIKGADAAEATVDGLNAKTRYYVCIRAYRKVGKKTYYSAWSKPKKVKVK